MIKYFNPRSHERSDKKLFDINYFKSKISIHAPTRGATYIYDMCMKYDKISIHAPTRGATKECYQCFYNLNQFQSTLPREERRKPCCGSLLHNCISIHAPTRGATIIISMFLWIFANFNPRSHERSDKDAGTPLIMVLVFQSTLPREERRSHCARRFQLLYFNPRSHERSDEDGWRSCSWWTRISIHAPTRGATLNKLQNYKYDRVFQSTLPREERHTAWLTMYGDI